MTECDPIIIDTETTEVIIVDALNNVNAVYLQGYVISSITPTAGQTLQYVDGSWTPSSAGSGDMSQAAYDPAGVSEQLVGLTAEQTITNKIIDTTYNTITVVESDISDLRAYLLNLVEDTSPQLGGNLDANSKSITGVVLIDYDRAQALIVDLGNLGATEEINWSAGTHFTGTLNDDVTITHTTESDGQKITLFLSYDGSAQRAIVWSDVDVWAGGAAPTTPAVAGETLVVTMIKQGTTVYASGEVFSAP